MRYRFARFLLASLALGLTACYGRYDDHHEHDSYSERAPGRDNFVGSIYFTTSSSALSRSALADLTRMATRIRHHRHSNDRIILIGYSDRSRGVEENSELAAERAQRVAVALEKRGIDLDRIVIDGRGVRMTRHEESQRRVDIYTEHAHGYGHGHNEVYYPVLIAFFLLTAFITALVVFRRRR
jgi:hypothetical protein